MEHINYTHMNCCKFSTILFLFFCFSCNHVKNNSSKKINHLILAKSQDREEDFVNDTINDNFKLHYLENKGLYNVVVSIERYQDTLKLNIDTNSPPTIFPKVLEFKNNVLYLAQGEGFSYRNIIVCTLKDTSIQCHQYETSRVDNDAPDYFIYQNIDRLNKINYINRVSKKHGSFVLNKDMLDTLKKSELFKDSVVMIFTKRTITKKLNGIK